MRLASFSGDTDADSRRQLISAWNNNQIDIMIATSAFGLGVDKRDIRAVVHATLPENIDRFYQEVGRGGRDGYSAVSLVCATEDSDEMKSDVDLAYSLQGRIITLDKALPRWLGMLETARADGDVRWVDRDATPEGRPEVGRSERNREWNDHLLLLMQRARLVEIADATPPRVGEDGTLLYHLPIRILVPEVFNDPSHALDRIEPFREREKEENRVAAKGIISLVSDYARGNANDCLSSRFAAMYANVQRACGGCPVCRTSDQDPFCDPLEFSVHFPVALRRLVSESAEISAALRRKLGAWRSLISTWNGPRTLHRLASSVDLIPQLVHAGFQQVIYPADWLEDAALRDRFVRALATPGPHQQPNFHRIVPDRWVYEKDYPLFPLATVIVYSPENCSSRSSVLGAGKGREPGHRLSVHHPPGSRSGISI